MAEHNKALWKLDANTRRFVDKVKEKRIEISRDLSNGILLIHETSEKISREYAFNSGLIEGLRFLESYLDIEEDESNDRSESVLGQDGN